MYNRVQVWIKASNCDETGVKKISLIFLGGAEKCFFLEIKKVVKFLVLLFGQKKCFFLET
jgi:hypothetical protein